MCVTRWQCHTASCICLCVTVDIHRVGQEPCGPSAGLTQPQHLCWAASTNNSSTACGYKQGEAQYRTISISPGGCSPSPTPLLPPHVQVKGYFSLIISWLILNYGANCPPKCRSLCTRYKLFSLQSFGCSGFSYWRDFQNPHIPGLQLVWEFIWGLLMFCLRANLDVFKTIQPN